jgi:isopentenyl-diphosphate delta-isomerase
MAESLRTAKFMFDPFRASLNQATVQHLTSAKRITRVSQPSAKDYQAWLRLYPDRWQFQRPLLAQSVVGVAHRGYRMVGCYSRPSDLSITSSRPIMAAYATVSRVAMTKLEEFAEIIVINESDRVIGYRSKREVHELGLLHRAFSVFIINEARRVLLQRRARRKYHSGGKWANSCCGHPFPREKIDVAARRRVREELGIDIPLRRAFTSRYRAVLDNGLVENELVVVYFGFQTGELQPNSDEVEETRYVHFEELVELVRRGSDQYAVWLQHYIREHRADLQRCIAAV